MKYYDFTKNFHALYDKAVSQFVAGQKDLQTYFTPDERAFLAANGISAQNLFDYAEDHTNYGEPGYDNALAIELVRRDYFLNVQLGRASTQVLNADKMPAKTDAVQGVEWLPRLIPKAKAKLRGELPGSLMYCCGGDRRFFSTHDILPSEFLTLVWRNLQDDEATIHWVLARIGKAK